MLGGRYTLAGEASKNSGIFLGRDEILDRPVALQKVAAAGVGSDYRDEAERTVGRAASLQHPQVVRVLDIVSDDSAGTYWLVTEPTEGITLSELVSGRGRLIVNEAAALTEQAADALAAAHEAGIVHGDVRPANILVDRLGRVKLTAFGIVRPPFDAAKDLAGDVAPYLSPEVLAGQPGDEAGDVWSLGATVLYALSGRPPFGLEHDREGGLVSAGNLPALIGAGSLTELLQQSLSTNAAHRWSMAQVRDHLAASSTLVTARMPVLLPRPTSWSDDDVDAIAEPEAEPRRLGALVAGRGVLVGLVVALVVAIAMGATMLGRSIDSKPTSATMTSSEDTSSPSPVIGTPEASSTIRPKSSASGDPSQAQAGYGSQVSVRAPHRFPSASRSASPSNSPVVYRSGSRSGSGHGSRPGSGGSHSAPPPSQSPPPDPTPPVITPPIDPPPIIDPPPVDPPPIDPPPVDPPPVDPPPVDPPPVDPAALF